MDFDFNARERPRRLAKVPVASQVERIDVTNEPIDSSGEIEEPSSMPTKTRAKVSPELEPFMDDVDDAENQDGFKKPKHTQPWYKRSIAFVKEHHRASIIVGAAIILLIGGGISYAMTRPAPKLASSSVKKAVKPKAVAPTPITSPLTGMVVSADEAKRPTTAVMIENTVFARPQSGLKEAGVVYEAIAEAGITRFLAIYQEAKPANIGPIRSSRPYYVDWAHSFDAAYAHVGGSPDALSKIKADGVKDLDQFFNPAYYHRISSRDAPHNVYTDMGQLDTAKTAKGFTSSSFTSWPRKADAPAKDAVVTARTVDIAISGPTYNTHYDYVPATNSYNRSEGGDGHVDAETKLPLSLLSHAARGSRIE